MANLGEMRCEYISLCKVIVYQDKNGHDEFRLRRLADIKGDEFIRFYEKDGARTFDNRSLLYFKNEHNKKVGNIGIWRWKAYEKSIYEQNKDYIDSQYEDYRSVIEIVKMEGCSRCEDVVKQLQKSKLDEYYGNKTLFTVAHDSDGKVTGVLCEPSDLGNIDGKVKLVAGVLSKFEIASSDVLSFSDCEHNFYKYTKLTASIGTVRVREPFSVIKEVIQRRIDKIKWLGFSQDEVELIQNFLTKLPNTSFVQEVATSCACNEITAERYIQKFKQNAGSYLSVGDLQAAILFRELKRDPAFVRECKAALTTDWQKENIAEQNEAKQKLEKITTELSNTEQKLSAKKKELNDIEDSILGSYGELENELKELENNKQKLEEEIKAKETLATEIEAKVSERIEVARKNVADFISEMFFANPQGSLCIGANSSGYKASCLLTTNEFICKPCGELTDLESFREELSYNLKNIGYNGNTDEMAEIVHFCLASKLPLVCKTNTLSIAQCVSAMFNNNKICVFDLPIESLNFNEFMDEVNRQIGQSKLVLVVNGVFDSFNLNLFNRIVTCLKTLSEKLVFILSLGGVAPETIPSYVWDWALFIDGDVGLEPCNGTRICSYVSDVDFKLNSDNEEVKDKFKKLSSFSSFLSNTARIHYAQLAANYDWSSIFTLLIVKSS